MDDPHIAWAFIACAFALVMAIMQLCVNQPKPPEPPRRKGDPPNSPIFPAF